MASSEHGDKGGKWAEWPVDMLGLAKLANAMSGQTRPGILAWLGHD